MPELNIRSVFHLTFEIKEIEEDRLPSFMCLLQLSIPHPTGAMEYTASDIWFESSEFSEFQKQLTYVASHNDGIAKLTSMSQEFSLVIDPDRADIVIEEIFPDSTVAKMIFSLPLDREQLSLLSNGFEAFPCWW